MFGQYVAVMIGGAIGAVIRYGIGLWMTEEPWKVLLINMIGCFLLGYLTAYAARTKRVPAVLFVGFGSGVLGGFTTFSTFSVDVVSLLKAGRLIETAVYLIGSLIGGLLTGWIGMKAGRWERKREQEGVA